MTDTTPQKRATMPQDQRSTPVTPAGRWEAFAARYGCRKWTEVLRSPRLMRAWKELAKEG